MIMIEVLTPETFSEEFMKEVEKKSIFSVIILVLGALPQRVREAKEARSIE